MAKKKPPQLKIVFDTNALFTQIAHQLFRTEVTDVIHRHSGHADLSISWHIPDTVIEERRHQMIGRANDLLPHLTKVESLLGHNLGISETILCDRVDAVIASQIDKSDIHRLPLDTGAVDWADLIRRALRREPPFDPGDKEKGFRDAIVAEAFLQMVESAPTTPSVCRLILITGDKLMTDYINSITKDRKNVYVLPDPAELDGLINTLASEVTEEFVAAIKEKCQTLFFVKDDQESLYYKEGLQKHMQDKFADTLAEKTGDATGRDNGTWWIPPPVFIRKEKQRVFWYTPINVDATAYRTEALVAGQLLTATLTQRLGSVAPTTKRIEVAKGKTNFNVHWSVNVSQKRTLSGARIGEIDNLGTKWESDDDD